MTFHCSSEYHINGGSRNSKINVIFLLQQRLSIRVELFIREPHCYTTFTLYKDIAHNTNWSFRKKLGYVHPASNGVGLSFLRSLWRFKLDKKVQFVCSEPFLSSSFAIAANIEATTTYGDGEDNGEVAKCVR